MHFSNAPIHSKVSIFASGDSINEIPPEDLQTIKNKTFVIALNLVDVMVPHMRFWSDPKLTDNWFESANKDCLWCARTLAYNDESKEYRTKDMVDFWFDNRSEGLGGDRGRKDSLFWLMELLYRNFKDKDVFIFGMDCKKGDNRSKIAINGKQFVKENEGQRKNIEFMESDLRRYHNTHKGFLDRFFNCSPESSIQCIEKIHYAKI